MVRARWASLAVAGGLLMLTGCSTSGSFLSRWFPTCRPGCECEDVVMSAPPPCTTGACPGGVLSHAGPSVIEGPALFTPGAPAVFPGATMPPASGGLRGGAMPPVVSVPKATPVPAGP